LLWRKKKFKVIEYAKKKNIIKNLFYEKFLGVLTKKGKKTIAKKNS